MAADSTPVIVTEAYSSRNLGDGELVAATLDLAALRWPESTTSLIALDVDSFAAQRTESLTVISRLFDRAEFAGASLAGRFLKAGRWLAFILAETLRVAFDGRKFGGFDTSRLLSTRERSAYRAYIGAQCHVAVGGGYLGDRYLKESILTLWSWWWSVRRGVHFETMPISVEADSWPMRLALRLLLPRDGVVVRDAASRDTLLRLGRNPQVLPDLAFRNVVQSKARGLRSGTCWVFPVGSDYFEEGVWRQQWEIVHNSLTRRGLMIHPFSMHRPLEGQIAGHDDEVVGLFRTDRAAVEMAQIETYAQLVGELHRGAALVVTARMHAAIASLCAGVPVVVLGYEEKHKTLMEMLGLDALYLPLNGFSSAQFERALDSAMSVDSEHIRRRVAEYASRLAPLWGKSR